MEPLLQSFPTLLTVRVGYGLTSPDLTRIHKEKRNQFIDSFFKFFRKGNCWRTGRTSKLPSCPQRRFSWGRSTISFIRSFHRKSNSRCFLDERWPTDYSQWKDFTHLWWQKGKKHFSNFGMSTLTPSVSVNVFFVSDFRSAWKSSQLNFPMLEPTPFGWLVLWVKKQAQRRPQFEKYFKLRLSLRNSAICNSSRLTLQNSRLVLSVFRGRKSNGILTINRLRKEKNITLNTTEMLAACT